MLASLLVVLPVFGLIALGYAARWLKIVRETTGEGLSDFVFVLAVPCLLFKTLATANIPAAQPWGYWIAYFAGLTIVWALAMLIARRVFARSGPELVVSGFAAAQSNTVFVGIPLILRAYGDAGAVPISLLLAVHLPVTMSIATLMIERADQGRPGLRIIRSLASHPILIGIALGLVWRVASLPLPGELLAVTRLLGDAAAPCALFALGISLRRYGFAAPPALLGALAALKLIAHPLVVYVLAVHVFTMPPVWAAVAVMFAACPSGVNGYLLAMRYGSGVALTSGAISLSTVLCAVSVPLWVWLVTGS